jgi:hypothetical protein
MTDARIIAECRDYAQLIAALRSWIGELGTAGETVDDVAGLPLRYTMKLLAPVPVKGLGRTSLGPLLGALGLKLIVAVDAEVLGRIRHRLIASRNANGAVLTVKGRKRKPYRAMRGNPELARMVRQIGILKLSPDQRSRIARKAARERWRRARLAGKPGSGVSIGI